MVMFEEIIFTLSSKHVLFIIIIYIMEKREREREGGGGGVGGAPEFLTPHGCFNLWILRTLDDVT